MEFHPSHQTPYFPALGVPDGFALVPLHLFLLMAQQLPIANGSVTFATFAKPIPQESVYDRAMTSSAN